MIFFTFTKKAMKRIILFLILIVCQNSHSQEVKKNKLQFHSFSVTFGSFAPQKGSSAYATWYTDFNLVTNYNKNLFAFSVDGSFDWLFSFMGEKPKRQNIQMSMLYGRQVALIDKVNFEILTGLGYFKAMYRIDNFDSWEDDFYFIKKSPDNFVKKISLNSFSIPVKLRVIFAFSKDGSAGLNYSKSFNSISNYSSIGVIFRHNF
jgi:hypothetical protein